MIEICDEWVFFHPSVTNWYSQTADGGPLLIEGTCSLLFKVEQLLQMQVEI